MRTADCLQIGEVAQATGLSLRSIRHYDEIGLAAPSARSEGGFRLYAAADVERLRLIMAMKPLGFSLQEMRGLLDVLAADGPAQELARYRTTAAARVAALRAQLATAESFAQRLGAQP